jgi:hypothetical protein
VSSKWRSRPEGGKRAIWQVNGNVKLYAGGMDAVASTRGDNTLFAVDGLFFP